MLRILFQVVRQALGDVSFIGRETHDLERSGWQNSRMCRMVNGEDEVEQVDERSAVGRDEARRTAEVRNQSLVQKLFVRPQFRSDLGAVLGCQLVDAEQL